MRKLAATLALLLGAGSAHADDVAGKLSSYETEARAIGQDLPQPNRQSQAAGARRLVDAEVAFSLGDYDTAALTLFDLAAKSQGADKEAATYYLAESLYQKGDKGAARTYFTELVQAANTGSKYYQPSLQRLVEIAIGEADAASGTDAMQKLDQVSPTIQLPSVPYIRGKLAFSQGKYDDALVAFNAVAKGSDYELQALYYAGTSYVAKQDAAKATDVFTDLIGRKPRTSNDRRVIELAQLALGRLYYERDQASKSIDSYLLIDRHSDLFPDALYEVAWVYVKSKQYDKALRALELLEQLDPQSAKRPTVRILEGNLRVRKAQMIRQSQINGTINTEEHSDPATEYDKATALFTDTHDQFMPSYVALTQMADGTLDPTSFVEQISGRSSHVFQLSAPIPDAAAQWLREQPEVQRIVNVEGDLASIKADLDQSEAIIGRLEGVLAANDRLTVYPGLAARRMRIAAIENDLIKIRNDLADQELRLVDSSGELAGLSATRKQLAAQYTALGDPEGAYSARLSDAHAGFDKIDDDALAIDDVIGSTQAIAVAVRKYANDVQPAMKPEAKKQLQQQIDDTAKEAQGIEDELAQLHKEVVLGKDLAGVGDEGIAQARTLRKQLQAAQDAEQRALTGFSSASRDRSKSGNLAQLADRASRITVQLEATDQQIDTLIANGLQEVRDELVNERKDLQSYKQELADYENEAKVVGGTVLGASFKDVKAKFYDVIVRTDLGNVDVSWSQTQDTDDDLKRLNLARSRELKQLRDEFRDILEEGGQGPAQPKKPAAIAPSPEGGAPTQPQTSPDKQTGKPADDRVKPVGEQPKTPATPTVKPDQNKDAKKGGAK